MSPVTPRKLTGNPPGRRPREDPASVRRVVRSARFTEAEAEALDASAVPLRDLALDGLSRRHASTDTPVAP